MKFFKDEKFVEFKVDAPQSLVTLLNKYS